MQMGELASEKEKLQEKLASLADGLEPADHPVFGGADPDAAGRPGGHPE